MKTLVETILGAANEEINITHHCNDVDKDRWKIFVSHYVKRALEEQAKLFMSCLPKEQSSISIVGFGKLSWNECLKEFNSNAEKLGLINKKDV